MDKAPAGDEYLDLVDDNDAVIGRMLRSEVHAKKLLNYRTINAFLVNSEGKLWIPRRTMHKRLFPGALDLSAAGHVESGETYDESFRREVQEELNIDIATVPWKLLGKVTPHEHGVHAFEQMYEIRGDNVPDYNPDDFTEYFWLTPNELLERIEGGDIAKSDLPTLVKIFYAN